MKITADAALEMLKKGNARFVDAKREYPRQCAARRKETANGQNPFAIILACSDSRVTSEIIFDQGLGDLFVVRVAGNVLDNAVIGSIEFAATYLGASLIVVLGHSNCGAIKAIVDNAELTPSLKQSLQSVVEVKNLVEQGTCGDKLKDVTEMNAKVVAESLRNMPPVLNVLSKEGKIKIVSGFHDLETGKVEFF